MTESDPFRKQPSSNTCVNCESKNVTERVETDSFQYGADHHPPSGGVVQFSVQVPVLKCGDCGFEWTDYRSEEIRDAAVTAHRTKVES